MGKIIIIITILSAAIAVLITGIIRAFAPDDSRYSYWYDKWYDKISGRPEDLVAIMILLFYIAIVLHCQPEN